MAAEPAYETREPINDLLLATHLLTRELSDRTHRYLVMEGKMPVRDECVIHVQYWNGGYGKCEFNGEERYLVDKSIAHKLQKLDALQELTGAQTLNLCGITAFDGVHCLRPRHGTALNQLVAELLRERTAKAQERIVPLVHTQWATTSIDPAGHAWNYPLETWMAEKVRDYYLTFHFKTAHGEKITVREDTGEVTSTYQPKKRA